MKKPTLNYDKKVKTSKIIKIMKCSKKANIMKYKKKSQQ